MVKLVFCCRRNPDLTREEFQRYWLEDHGKLVRSLREARRVLGRAGEGEDTLTLRVPMDGTVPTLKALLNELDTHGIELEDLSIHTPDLDDVFFAVTETRT